MILEDKRIGERIQVIESLPNELKSCLTDQSVMPLKSKKRTAVYRLEGQDGVRILKIAPPRERLRQEADMLRFLAGHALAPAPLLLTAANGLEYLMMEALDGEDATDDRHTADQARLCERLADSLLRLHNLPRDQCPAVNRLAGMAARAQVNYREGLYDPMLLGYMDYAQPSDAYRDMLDLTRTISDGDGTAIIHGDYCLPNVMYDGEQLSGFIDVGYGGIGDPHYDLFWGAWSLQFNLLDDGRWRDRFFDAYGRQRIDSDRLRLCGLVSVFNGFRGQDYY